MALIEPERERLVTFAELRDEVESLARTIAGLGAERGERVALVLPEGPQLIRFLLAVAFTGASAAPLNPGYTSAELRFYLDDLQPRFVLGSSNATAAARSAADAGLRFLAVDGSGPGGVELGGVEPADYEPALPNDVALVLHTSGTTNRPKQVPLLQRNLVSSARGITEFYGLSREDVSLSAMPLFHVHGLVASVLAALAGGGSVVVPTRFVPGRFARHARAGKVTWFSAAPTLHAMILDRLADDRVETLRFVRSCSSALPPDLFDRCEAAHGVPMLEAYGMTEGSHQIASNPLPPGTRKAGSVGLASAGVEIRIVGDSGRDVDLGEVAIKGPGLTPGYIANAVANDESFFGDGWFRTGDRGRFDGDGHLVLEGRIKELIVRGGENISPFEIETALAAHPLVADAVAFAIPDERYGEVVGAAVVLGGDADEESLRTWCAERLAPFKLPTRIFVLDEIPRTATGKLQRARIAGLVIGGDRRDP